MNLLKKKFFIFFGLFLILFTIQNCKDEKANNGNITAKPLTIQDIAKKSNSKIGEYSRIFRVDKSVRGPKGQYIVLNIISIKKYSEFTSNNNKLLKNVIVIENVTPADIVKPFLIQKAFFSLFDEYGNEDININTYVQTGKEFTEIILTSSNNISKIKYVLIGSLDRERNDGKAAKVFEIK